MSEVFGLDGKTAFITGAASGIGLATTDLLLQQGMKVVMVDCDSSGLERARERLALAYGGERIRVFTVNVADKEELCDVVEEAIRWSGGVHALVTSAGIVRRDGEGVYQEIFSVNVLGSMNSIEALRRNFEERRGGTIVMVGSIVGSHGWPERVVYCASKGAVEAGMRAYAMEFAKLGVRVNAVAPGLVWTPLMKKVVQGEPDAEQAFRFRAAQQALGAMLAPEDVAKHILFLASDLSSGILGATLDASGGRLAGHVPNTEHLGPHFEARWEEIKKEF